MGVFDVFKRSEQPADAIEAADQLLDVRPAPTTLQDALGVERRRLAAMALAQQLYEEHPVWWAGISQEQMQAMTTHWLALRWLVRNGRNPDLAVHQ